MNITQEEAQRIMNSLRAGIACLSCATAEEAHARDCLIDVMQLFQLRLAKESGK